MTMEDVRELKKNSKVSLVEAIEYHLKLALFLNHHSWMLNQYEIAEVEDMIARLEKSILKRI